MYICIQQRARAANDIHLYADSDRAVIPQKAAAEALMTEMRLNDTPALARLDPPVTLRPDFYIYIYMHTYICIHIQIYALCAPRARIKNVLWQVSFARSINHAPPFGSSSLSLYIYVSVYAAVHAKPSGVSIAPGEEDRVTSRERLVFNLIASGARYTFFRALRITRLARLQRSARCRVRVSRKYIIQPVFFLPVLSFPLSGGKLEDNEVARVSKCR